MKQNGEYPGVSPPLSLEPPSETDLRLSEALMNELKAQNNFESREESARREEVLKKLQQLLVQLVQIVGKKKGLPQELLKEAGGKVFTYGSYRLGVYGPGSDIDSLMVAPKHVTRDDFFTYMPDLIRKAVPPEELPELTEVPDAGVPIIKLEISGVPVDLIFSALQVPSVPKTLDLSDNTLLRGLDGTDMRCVNGTRVTDRILQLVPQSKIFRFALRAIKLWAQKRAIYGNVIGFPGGVAWGMLVARVCQLYPKAAASHIVNKFFFVISKWNWPKPVFLQQRESVPYIQEKEWDPTTYKGDTFHLMPVITPAFPCMNSTVTIGRSQRSVILKELDRGRIITDEIYAGKKQWKDLFVRHTFFSESYKHYICVITASRAKDAQHAWSGLVQARLRRLITGIEYSDADCVKLVHPFNKGFNGEHECKNDAEIMDTLNGSLQHQIAETKTTEESADVKAAIAAQSDGDALAVASLETASEPQMNGATKLWTTRYYLGIELQPGKANLDISRPIAEFTYNCQEWDKYNDKTNYIRIKHVRNYDLPDDVFVEGEARPQKKKKTKKPQESTPATEVPAKKRSLNNAGLDENQDPAKRRQSGHAAGTKAGANGPMVTNGTAG